MQCYRCTLLHALAYRRAYLPLQGLDLHTRAVRTKILLSPADRKRKQETRVSASLHPVRFRSRRALFKLELSIFETIKPSQRIAKAVKKHMVYAYRQGACFHSWRFAREITLVLRHTPAAGFLELPKPTFLADRKSSRRDHGVQRQGSHARSDEVFNEKLSQTYLGVQIRSVLRQDL